MLYGMDDDDNEFNEFALEKTSKLNIKKVILVIAVVLVCIFSVIGVFVFGKNNKNDNEKLAIEGNATVEDNNDELINDQGVNEVNSNDGLITEANIENLQNTVESANEIKEPMQIPIHSSSEIEAQFFPQENLNGAQQIKDIYYSEEKQVYLTFDDGPSKDITNQVLDILKEHDVKATFFVLGARVELYPDVLRRAFYDGHYIANHGYSHKYSEIYQSKDTVFQEYIECENAIRKALNNELYNSYLFRFPGGSSGGRYSKVKVEAREHLESHGIAFTNWNCLTGDAENKTTKEECIQEMLNTKGDQNSIILLMHDANDKQQTVDALPEIIQYFKNEGYTFKNFYEIF